ncbi:mechanosensitive ion channel [Candidatus Parcubacteria bacterium]|nr:mechanosensitive ion channel [Candidatus Parcubacteria bacterium]
MILENFFQNLILWFFSSGIKIVLILFAANLAIRYGRIFILKVIKGFIKKSYLIRAGKNENKIQEERQKTLENVFSSALKVVIWLAAGLMILPELGINIAPLLAGIGVMGLAFGMGAKGLIQDYLSGLFIIIEDQYRVGEKVKIAGINGEVKNLNLRKTTIKDLEGVEHYVPNGQIKIISNFSRNQK